MSQLNLNNFLEKFVRTTLYYSLNSITCAGNKKSLKFISFKIMLFCKDTRSPRVCTTLDG